MYVPPHFVEARTEVLHHLIEKNPLGILFTNGKSGF
ncbi:FMN-binding negative transcriptional regulator [Bradyrhizobium sp. 155]